MCVKRCCFPFFVMFVTRLWTISGVLQDLHPPLMKIFHEWSVTFDQNPKFPLVKLEVLRFLWQHFIHQVGAQSSDPAWQKPKSEAKMCVIPFKAYDKKIFGTINVMNLFFIHIKLNHFKSQKFFIRFSVMLSEVIKG